VVKPEEVKAALDQLQLENLKHYNAHCPKCGKANKVSKKQLLQAAPNWTPPKKAPIKKTAVKTETK
jgi:PHP family Zn ribbon phosphoesterase